MKAFEIVYNLCKLKSNTIQNLIENKQKNIKFFHFVRKLNFQK